jgi:hypothetical protein
MIQTAYWSTNTRRSVYCIQLRLHRHHRTGDSSFAHLSLWINYVALRLRFLHLPIWQNQYTAVSDFGK